MSLWHLRPIADCSRFSACSAESLRDMLRSGVLGDQHEYRPPKEERWIGWREALRLLAADQEAETAPVDESEEFASVSDDGAFDLDDEEVVVGAIVSDFDGDRSDDVVARQKEPRREPASTRVASVIVSVPDTRSSRFLSSELDEEEDELDMTPMIDMTFLLLIFFMVTSSVTRNANLELPPSMTGRAEETQTRIVLVADFPEALTGDDRKSFVGAKFVTLADAKLYFEEEADRVFAATEIEAELQRAFAAKPNCQFILQANRKMPVGVVRQLLKAAAQSGAKETLVGVTMPR